MFVVLTLAVTNLPVAAGQAVTERYDETAELLYAGRIAEVRELLEEFLEGHPKHWLGHWRYRRAVGRTASQDTMPDAVRSSVAPLARVPIEKRDESFSSAFMEGARLLGDTALWQEAVRRFPRGLSAEHLIPRSVDTGADPVQAAEICGVYIDQFPENVSWTQPAPRDRLELLGKHPDHFSLKELVAAAEGSDRLSVACIPLYGNPTIRPHAITRIVPAGCVPCRQ